jgi:hypothetical protein
MRARAWFWPRARSARVRISTRIKPNEAPRKSSLRPSTRQEIAVVTGESFRCLRYEPGRKHSWRPGRRRGRFLATGAAAAILGKCPPFPGGKCPFVKLTCFRPDWPKIRREGSGRRKRDAQGGAGMNQPRTLSVVIAAHNEQDVIARTIERCLAARDDPTHCRRSVEIIVVSDGSNDRTAEIARGCAEVKSIVFEKLAGGRPHGSWRRPIDDILRNSALFSPTNIANHLATAYESLTDHEKERIRAFQDNSTRCPRLRRNPVGAFCSGRSANMRSLEKTAKQTQPRCSSSVARRY